MNQPIPRTVLEKFGKFHIFVFSLIISLLNLPAQDLHLVDLEHFKYAGTNLTAFRLVDPQNANVRVRGVRGFYH